MPSPASTTDGYKPRLDGSRGMTGGDDDGGPGEASVRVWLVRREYDDRNLVTLTYATPDGERVYERQQSASVMRGRNVTVTAGKDVAASTLRPVEDPDTVDRYATEATRVREEHDHDEEL